MRNLPRTTPLILHVRYAGYPILMCLFLSHIGCQRTIAGSFLHQTLMHNPFHFLFFTTIGHCRLGREAPRPLQMELTGVADYEHQPHTTVDRAYTQYPLSILSQLSPLGLLIWAFVRRMVQWTLASPSFHSAVQTKWQARGPNAN